MTHHKEPNRPFGHLFDHLRDPGENRTHLQQALQLAVQIEFTTIPAYLTALYSIKQPDSQAYQLLRSVVMEEMYHVNQAANLLVAIGGLPKFTGDATPRYPGYLPHANPETTPYVGLYRASPDVFENVFAAIETPAPPHAPPQGQCYDTIKQVYDAAVDGLKLYAKGYGEDALFSQAPNGRQRTDIYLGKFGGKPLEVRNMDDAAKAVTEILQQGEGGVPEGQSYVPIEPWGAYNHYGQRTDGTYGPIVGTPYEMSHFKKFRTVALDTANFPDTYPIVSNPQRSDFHDKATLAAAEAFDMAYSIMLDMLERSFRKPSHPAAPDPFFTLGLPLMHEIMPALARTLMTRPTRADGDSSVGPNAAPTFLYREGCTLVELSDKLKKVDRLTQQSLAEGNFLSANLALLGKARESADRLIKVHASFQE